MTDNVRTSSADISPVTFGEAKAKRIGRFFRRLGRNVTIEPAIFLWWFGMSIQVIITPNLYYEKVCRLGSTWFGNGTGYSDDICNHLDNGEYDEIQEEVQKTVSRMNFISMFVKSIPALIFVLFIGSWSDKAGRKMLFLIPLVGFILCDIFLLFNAIFFEEMAPEYLLLEVFRDWFGGSSCFFLGAYSYISDVSKGDDRVYRIAVMDCCFFISMAIGNGVSGKIYVSCGYEAIYGIGIAIHVLTFLYVVFLIKEPSELKALKLKKRGIETPAPPTLDVSISSIFNVRNVTDSFRVAFRKRRGSMRHVVILLILLFFVNGLAMHGTNSNANNYVRKKFVWEDLDVFNVWWSRLSSISSIFSILAVGLIVPLMSKVAKMSDMLVAIISFTSLLLGTIVYIVAWTPNILYLANALKMFSDASTIAIRAALTKIVGPLDVGKVFACIAGVQALSDLAAPVYNLIYIATIDWHLAMVYCITATLLALVLLVCVYVYVFLKRYQKKHGAFMVAKSIKAMVAQTTDIVLQGEDNISFVEVDLNS